MKRYYTVKGNPGRKQQTISIYDRGPELEYIDDPRFVAEYVDYDRAHRETRILNGEIARPEPRVSRRNVTLMES